MEGGGYTVFAEHYDALTSNIDYRKRAEYFRDIADRFGGAKNGILLDLACGTGSLSVEFARMGYDVIGADSSPEMLSHAIAKKSPDLPDIQFLCQDMTELDMFGTIDITVCALDSLNHLPDTASIRKAIEKVSLFTIPGGLFIFDMNTPYKHREVLADNIFVYETDDVYCVWKCSADTESDVLRTDIILDFFEKTGKLYRRSSESFSEIAPADDIINGILAESGFELLAEYEGDTFEAPGEKTERIVRAARKRST